MIFPQTQQPTIHQGTSTVQLFSYPQGDYTPVSSYTNASPSTTHVRDREDVTSDGSGSNDYDGETSVAGTDTTTELDSETTSLGSLTSVD